MRRNSFYFFPAAVLVLFLGLNSAVHAQTVWTGTAGDGVYGTAGNWNAGVPSSTNAGTINTSADITGFTVPASTSLTINGGAVVNANTDYFYLNAGTSVKIGGDSAGSLTANSYTQLIGTSVAPAVLTVGTNGTFTANSYLLLGTAASHYGTIIVDGGTLTASSSSFTVGDNGTGVVTLNSGTLNINSTFEIGNHSSASGTVNMYGGTLKAAGRFSVGGGDSATNVNKSKGVFNYYGGTLTSTNVLQVGFGNGATGTFNVKTGADLSLSCVLRLGDGLLNTNRATGNFILEAGTAENKTTFTSTNEIQIATKSNGNLTVNSNAEFTTTGVATIASGAEAVGTMTIRDGGVAALQNLNLATVVGASATLNVEAGGTLNFVHNSTMSGGSGTVNFNINGNVTTTGSQKVAFNTAATAIQAAGSGNLTLGLTQVDGNHQHVYFGNGSGKYATLNVTDSATLNITSTNASNQIFGIGTESGTGVLNYNSSGTSNWNGTLRLGWGGASNGTIYLKDGVVKHTGGYFIVGSSAKGRLEVSGDAQLTCNNLFIGDASTSKAGTIGGDIVVTDSAKISTNVIYLADKVGTYGNLTVSDSASVTIGGNFRIGTSQHFNDETGTNRLGGGTANATVDGGTVQCAYFYLGNMKAPSELNILSGTFQTTGTNENITYGNAKITLAGGAATTVSFAGALTLGDGTALNITDKTDFDGTSLKFSGNNHVEIDGIYEFADLSGALSFTGTGNTLTINIDDPYAIEDGTYSLISAASNVGSFDTVSLVSAMGTTILASDSPYLNYTNGLILSYSGEVAPLPEPAAWLLLLLAIPMIPMVQKMKRNFQS